MVSWNVHTSKMCTQTRCVHIPDVHTVKMCTVWTSLKSSRTIILIIVMATVNMGMYYRTQDSTCVSAVVHRSRGPIDGDDPLVVALVREKYLQQPSNLPYNLSTNPRYKAAGKQDSWGLIYAYIRRMFEGERSGVFIESGALDGEYLSNTLWLEQELGWTGLLVEPDPDSFRQLTFKHRKAWTTNTCLSRTTYPQSTIHVGLRLWPEYIGNRWNYRGSSHTIGVQLGSAKYEKFLSLSEESYHTVQCFPLVSYIRALNMTTVDLLVLDMQGVEKDVLRAFLPSPDLTVRVIVVELTADTPDLTFQHFMTTAGYIWVNQDKSSEWSDYIYVKRSDPIFSRRGFKTANMMPVSNNASTSIMKGLHI